MRSSAKRSNYNHLHFIGVTSWNFLFIGIYVKIFIYGLINFKNDKSKTESKEPLENTDINASEQVPTNSKIWCGESSRLEI